MHFANIDDTKEIMDLFKLHKDIFPYVRKDYIERMIKSKNVIFEDGFVIVFKKYKRKQHIGNCMAQKDDISWSEFVCKNPKHAIDAIKKFIKFVKAPIWSLTRENNIKMRIFNERIGFKKIGNIFWKNGELPGLIYYYNGDI